MLYEVITKLQPGFVQLQISSIGYTAKKTAEFRISNVRPNYVEITLESSTETLEEVKVKAAVYAVKAEAPVSLRP